MATFGSQKKRRSRGCDQCRRRRVKCDETAEYCKQCLRLGLECSGLLEGAFIVDMTRDISAFPLPNIVKTKRSKIKMERRSSISSSTNVGNSLATLPKPLKTVNMWLDSVAPVYQSSSGMLSDQLFLAQFMDFSTSGRHSHRIEPGHWILSVQEQVSCSKLPSFTHSMRAATSAFHAFIHQDRVAKEASCRFYIASLSSHRKFLAATKSNTKAIQDKPAIPGVEEILVPLFLCLFEVVSFTTSAGCFQHLQAALEILSLRGPQNCGSGVAHEIFKSMRVSDACIALLVGRTSFFASEDWCTLPFLLHKKNNLHHLVDILIYVPSCLDMTPKSQESLNVIAALQKDTETRQALIRQNCLDILQRLSLWWCDFENENSRLSDINNYENLSTTKFAPSTFIYANTFTAFTVSLFDAVSLFLHVTLAAITPQARSSHLAQATSHASSILLISEFQQQSCVVGLDLIRSTFALKAVEVFGPSEDMKVRAREISKCWHKRGLGGILRVC